MNEPFGGRLVSGQHILTVRAYYEDTDFSGNLYHASYLRFLERGRTELLRAVSVSQRALHGESQGLAFVVRRMTLDYLKPAHMDDILEVRTSMREARGASMVLAQDVRRGGEILVNADVTVVCVRNGKATRLPEELRKSLAPEL